MKRARTRSPSRRTKLGLIQSKVHAIFLFVRSADPTQLKGYQEVPDNLPEWKKAMIKKKNDSLVEEHMVRTISSPGSGFGWGRAGADQRSEKSRNPSEFEPSWLLFCGASQNFGLAVRAKFCDNLCLLGAHT